MFSMTEWNNVRQNFPITETSAYLNSAAFSVTCLPACNAVKEFAEKMLFFQEHVWADSKRIETREEVAKLIHASPTEVGLGEGATYGLTTFARTISKELERGDNVITTDMEFFQGALPWLQAADAKGLEVRAVKNRDGRYGIPDFEKLIDDRTRVIALSAVEWNNGFKNDLAELGDIAEKRDIYLVVDAAQHLGASDFDTRKIKVDFMAASSHKWLVSPFGVGIFYVSGRVLDSVDPDFVGHSNTRPPRGWTRAIQFFENPDSSPLERFTPVKGEARKFEVGGTSNYPGAVALRASLKLINEIGIESIAERDLELGEYLIRGLQKLGVRIHSPLDREHRAGITTFQLSKTAEEEKKFVTWLIAQRIYVSLRYTSNVGGVRVSTHFYNNEEDIERLLDATKRYSQEHPTMASQTA